MQTDIFGAFQKPNNIRICIWVIFSNRIHSYSNSVLIGEPNYSYSVFIFQPNVFVFVQNQNFAGFPMQWAHSLEFGAILSEQNLPTAFIF